jgi:hypothetical protein
MSGGYRITVRGAMSERFCQGFPGLSHRVIDDRTVLEGGPLAGSPLDDILSSLDNLGLEVLSVESARDAHADPMED